MGELDFPSNERDNGDLFLTLQTVGHDQDRTYDKTTQQKDLSGGNQKLRFSTLIQWLITVLSRFHIHSTSIN